MDHLLAQIILAARNDDFEGWMNILFVVIIAVFWALGGILKAKTKNVKEEAEETSSDRPPRKRKQLPAIEKKDLFKRHFRTRSVGPETSRQYRRQIEQLRRRVSRSRPIAVSMETEKKAVTISDKEIRLEARATEQAVEVQQAIREHPELKSEPIDILKNKYPDIQSERAAPVVYTDSLLNYTDPDELKRAILHYEILGRPLSMRGPDEHIIRL